MERVSEETQRDETRTGVHASANQLGGGTKWDGGGASVNVEEEDKEREREGGGVRREGRGLFIFMLCWECAPKETAKTTAAGARPSRHERGE